MALRLLTTMYQDGAILRDEDNVASRLRSTFGSTFFRADELFP